MALVLFESRVNMITAATPSSIGGFLVGYDTLDGVLKQKDHLGVITPIGSGGGIGSLAQTLSIGNNSGTNSIYLGIDTIIQGNSESYLKLDSGGDNYVQLTTSGLATGSTLLMSESTIQLSTNNTFNSVSSNLELNNTELSLNFGTNKFLLQNNNSYLKLGTTNVLEFTTATSSRATGNRVPGFISSNGSRFSSTVSNSVIIGGSGIVGTLSNSVYVPNLLVKDGGYIKGTIGTGQLKFNSSNEVYISSATRIIGIIKSENTHTMGDYSGIFITDTDSTFTTPSDKSSITFISSSNATVGSGLSNTVVIGGQDLIIDNADTVYLGGTVDVNNQYKLPLEDGTSGQFIKTDGLGNLTWASATIDLTSTGLVTPTIVSTWDIYKSGGTTSFGPTAISLNNDVLIVGTFSTQNTVTVPVGCVVKYTGRSTIPAASIGLSTPTARISDFPFAPGVLPFPLVSGTLSTTGITSNTPVNVTYTTTITKPKTGLIVSGSQVVAATGNDSTSVSASVSFSNLFYFGYLSIGAISLDITQGEVDSLVSAQIEGLGNYRFGGKAQTFVSNDGGAGSRLVFAYPSSLGDLTTLTYTGSTVNSVLAFTKRTSALTITTLSGISMSYTIYVANADNAWGNGVSLTITTT